MGARYREMEIKTATPEMVIVKLYQGALRFIRMARTHQQAGDIAQRAAAIARALAIVNELQHSLNLNEGGEIARNLDSLYFFVTDRLLEANVKGTLQPLDDATGVLTTLGEAWEEISQRPQADSRVTTGPSAVGGRDADRAAEAVAQAREALSSAGR